MRCVGSITSADFVLQAKKPRDFEDHHKSQLANIWKYRHWHTKYFFKNMLWGSFFSTSPVTPFKNARFID